MEAKSRRRTRRPLSDCTNSIDSLNTSQSSSTSTKHSSSIIKPSKFLPTTTTKPTETQKQSTTGCTPQNDNPPSNPSTVSLSTPPRAGNLLLSSLIGVSFVGSQLGFSIVVELFVCLIHITTNLWVLVIWHYLLPGVAFEICYLMCLVLV